MHIYVFQSYLYFQKDTVNYGHELNENNIATKNVSTYDTVSINVICKYIHFTHGKHNNNAIYKKVKHNWTQRERERDKRKLIQHW